jgi:hypothetical protein
MTMQPDDIFPDDDAIEYRTSLLKWVRRLKSAVQDGDLVQFFPKKANYSYGPIPVEGLEESKLQSWPDILAMFFRSPKSGRLFKLGVDLYHGRRGYWKVINPDDPDLAD